MAKRIRRKLKKVASKRTTQKGFLTRIKFVESYTSLILGAIVVLIAGIFLLSFAKVNRTHQVSSIMETPKTWDQISQDSNTSSTYTVNVGDDLWTISQNVYNDGFKWVEIARVNNIVNPGLIRVGDRLTLPVVTAARVEKAATEVVAQAPMIQDVAVQNTVIQNTVAQNNSITGNSYTVVSGDNLWDIAVRAYGDGFRWPEIAKANNLANPILIHPGNVFIIPR